MNESTFLEKLLDGAKVEWVPLGEAAQYSKTRLSSETLNESNYVGVENLLQNRGGRTDSKYVPLKGSHIEYSTGDVLIGNIRPYLKKVWHADRDGGTNGDVLVVRSVNQNLDTRYLYHLLSSDKFFSYNMQYAKGAKMPRGNKVKILEYQIPIPCPESPEESLAIQAEIVRILDAFTELTAELKAELTARTKQYNYYRDQLLVSQEGEAEWIPLGQIGEPRMCKRILKNQTSTEGEIPFYKIGTFGNKPDSFIPKEIFEDYRERYNYPKIGEILISASGTIGRAVIFDGEIAYFQDSNIVWIENDERLVLNKYLFYFYQIIKWHVADGGVIKRLYNGNIRKSEILIPFPSDRQKSLAEQARVVAILDKFDTLIHSISEGLPREIELRQKQYEYYRDFILNCPKPQTEIVA